ncbi:TPA: 16S rRNA (uracil(1498)-N(3))-methyltransferase [Neisseria subflava]|jgi:RNA methyltransferase, rsmE family|uniref:16S rRNA (uracil(1498)-N(3))-methyltransferase n=1 Tax=unclassified Neisseria TaxID=2623750 RepID=UPI0008A30D72|nr:MULTISPECIES: 16S rRNA (uracil(1498)-N(3))-methyltransferase [unclassified Neisseria]OFK87713.1 16S rRNA (uracil(1498)-N(3))-methyltransferase [Neisseria sp. HMSC061E12]OFP77002.1 16S rRNA (uracil(1498)-N(3))-methyltransferase [Neisseria sp. HMSC066B07]OHO82812.1 16S rRNA (uracil(1498)-N(3))-methyltransferase [Neisseria sp. HMSC056A04]OHQ25496.1 16S rRNA (uracil(1498)-N(3))-methyltransferase [Neisseria sp. HMSC066F04]OHR15958.1 16S rRNA (uracil(1498)-N(3))-methyltransferase [Neisseria sp. H
MPRFYVDFALSPDSVVELPDNVVRHLNVLRVKNTEEIVLFNGNGKAYPALPEVLEKRRASVRIVREEATDNESPLNITLVQAVSAAERMDFTLQKSVELGVAEIRPVISERCVVRLSGERAEKRVARWQEIVVSACEQSGRNIVPKVLPLTTYAQALQQLPQETTKLLMSLNRAQNLSDVRPQSGKVVFMVGPEGGWTEKEEQQAFDAGFQSVTLGKRVLRTETASLAAIAAMQTLWGDFA